MDEFSDLQQLHHLCRLRSTLEAFAITRLRERSDFSSFQQMLAVHLTRLKCHAQEGDYPGFHEADMMLHRSLVEGPGIPALLRSWEDVTEELAKWIRHVQVVYWPSLMTLYREHEFLMEAWTSGEPWVAEQATHHHLEAGWFRVASAQGRIIEDIDPVDKATSFICTHYVSDIDVEWLAQNVSFVSASHLTRLFRTRKGISPHAFLKQVRMEHAAELLRHSQDPIALVAQKVGYKSPSHFSRDFRQKYGITPAQHRG